MGKRDLIKSISLVFVKVISFIVANVLLQKLMFIPLKAISGRYWAQYDGRGLNEPWFLSISISIFFSALLTCFLFLKYFDKNKWSYIRLTFQNYAKYCASGIAISFIIIIIFTLINLSLGNSELKVNFSSFTNVILYAIIISIGVFALVAFEELVFRGYILKTCEVHFNKTTAVILSSLLFSAGHFLRPYASFLAFANIFLAGIILSLICIFYNSLWVPFGIHFGWNYFLWLFNYPISNERWTNPLFKLNYKFENLIMGSKFGPEDSILVTIILVFAIGYFLIKHKNKDRVEHAINM